MTHFSAYPKNFVCFWKDLKPRCWRWIDSEIKNWTLNNKKSYNPVMTGWSEIAFMVYSTILSQVRSCWIYYFHVTKTLFQNFQSFTMIFLLPWLQVSCNCKLYNPPKNLCSVNREERVKSEEWLVAWRREKRRSTWKRRRRRALWAAAHCGPQQPRM